MDKTIQIPNFGSGRITENVLFGLADYLKNYLLPPGYKPITLDSNGNPIRDGSDREIEVRVYWRGKPRVVPFIVLAPAGNFIENRSNFDMESVIDEYIENINGVNVAFRERGVFGEMNVKMTIGSDGADQRVEICDYVMSKLTRGRGAWVYQEPDGMGSVMIAFTSKAFKMGELKEIPLNNGAEYLYFADIDLPMFVEYHSVEQITPGVMTSVGIVGYPTSTGAI